ncbi:Uncharacterised protein [Mycobacteroides abscessus subsp. abscessus]|nr:Uncharacterised protein [Mycobacteroides abscessus subsp. abscessus]
MPPNSLAALSAMAIAESGSETSTPAKMALPPSATICLATPSPTSALISATTTAAPSRASACAYASPMPCAAPVTMATLLSNSPIILSSSLLFHCRRNDFGFQIFLETGHTHLPAVARLLVSAEGCVGRIPDTAVDVYRSDP